MILVQDKEANSRTTPPPRFPVQAFNRGHNVALDRVVNIHSWRGDIRYYGTAFDGLTHFE